MPARTTSIRGVYIVAAVALLVGFASVGGYLVLREHPSPTDIVDMINLDGEYAVVVRNVGGTESRSFISLYQRERGERWGALIPRYDPGAATARVAVTDQVVFVRTVSHRQPSLFAFDGARGYKLGRLEPYTGLRPGSDTGYRVDSVGSLFGDGQVFELFDESGEWTDILGFGLKDGTLLWRAQLGPVTVERAWLRTRHIVLSTREGIAIVERDSGDVLAAFPIAHAPCVIGETIYAHVDGRVQSFSLPPRGSSGDVNLQAMGQPVAVEGRLLGACGRTGRHELFSVGDARGTSIVATEVDTGSPAWRVSIADAEALTLDEVARHTPDFASLSGTLTRFTPILAGPHLAMLDTRTGVIAWRSPDLAWLRTAHIMRVDRRHYLYAPDRHILAVFDGASGQMQAARSLERYADVWPRHIAGGRIWLASGTRWAVIDAQTLMSSAGIDAVGTDVRDAMIAELGTRDTGADMQ